MILSILSNSVVLAAYDYSDPLELQKRNQILSILDKVFTSIYTMEALLKILAYGFVIHRKSYLRDSWNIFDFSALVVSYISMLPNIPNMKVMRVLRVLKPLRSINAVPSMKRLFTTLLMSIP